LFKKAHNILDSYLDISNIVHKLEEFEKLKIIILNQEQLAMFQLISNDIISLEEKEERQSEIKQLKNLTKNKEKMVKMILEYKNKLGDSNASVLDKKMFSLLDIDFRNTINKLTEKNIKSRTTTKMSVD
jgi:hypothetical protein